MWRAKMNLMSILLVSVVASQQLDDLTSTPVDISSQENELHNSPLTPVAISGPEVGNSLNSPVYHLLQNMQNINEVKNVEMDHKPTSRRFEEISHMSPIPDVKYVEIDHQLTPRRVEEINDMSPIPVFSRLNGKNYKMKKYPVQKRNIQDIILDIEDKKKVDAGRNVTEIILEMEGLGSRVEDSESWKDESEIHKSKLESVLGTEGEVYYDADWGLMSAVLACYNNHWALRTGPEDWWTVAIRRIVQALDEHGEVPEVRDFFVQHKGKKKININVGPSLSNLNYNWLFSQFSEGIRGNINVPSYVDIIENDFSCSTVEQTMISQIMLMSSMKNYFEFGMYTMCGIPGVEMKGTEQDWMKLVNKINELEQLLIPIEKYLELENWFNIAKDVFKNLLATYRGKQKSKWWSQILSWKEVWGSGMRPHWSGWFPEFVGVSMYTLPDHYRHFPSDLVTVPIHIEDNNNDPVAVDDGILVAGIVGFNVKEGGRAPVVEPTHAWSLLLPEDSPVADRLTGSYTGPELAINNTSHQIPSYESIYGTHDVTDYDVRKLLTNESSTGAREESYSGLDSRFGATRQNTHRQRIPNENSADAHANGTFEEHARFASTLYNDNSHRHRHPHKRINDTSAENNFVVHTPYDLSGYNNRHRQQNDSVLSNISPGNINPITNTVSTPIKHRINQKQLNNNYPSTNHTKTNLDTDSSPLSTGYSTHDREIANKNPIVFSDDESPITNTSSDPITHSDHYQQDANKVQTVTPMASKPSTNKSGSYFCWRLKRDGYTHCNKVQLRKLLKRYPNAVNDGYSIVINDESPDICERWCQKRNRQKENEESFCCRSADKHALHEHLRA